MKTKTQILFIAILIGMLFVTAWATLQESVVTGGVKLFAEPWGIATLADAYCGFLTFFVWVAYKERTILAKLLWFVTIMLLGNIAMASYVLWQIGKSKNGSFESIVLRHRESERA
jgi:hypothetical protein